MQAWSDVAHNFRGDWQMLWKEIGAGFLIAGYVSLLPAGFFNGLFVTDAPTPVRIAENVVVGPVVAALAFVCSIGNIPLAAVLWAGGISFSGVIAFLFADLLIPPIVLYYRKVYGRRFAALLVAVMFGSLIIASLVVDALVLARGARADAPAVGRLDHGSARHLELHVGARHPVRARVRRAPRADVSPRRQRSGVRHGGRPPLRQPDVGLRREDVVLLRRPLQAPLRRAA